MRDSLANTGIKALRIPASIEPRRQHSRKPDCVHQRIERLVAGPYVELFARQRRSGWDCWGNQADRFKEVVVPQIEPQRESWDEMWHGHSIGTSSMGRIHPFTRERVQVSMILSAEIKTLIIETAKRHGCSFSEAGEMLLRRALIVDALLKRLDRLHHGSEGTKP